MRPSGAGWGICLVRNVHCPGGTCPGGSCPIWNLSGGKLSGWNLSFLDACLPGNLSWGKLSDLELVRGEVDRVELVLLRCLPFGELVREEVVCLGIGPQGHLFGGKLTGGKLSRGMLSASLCFAPHGMLVFQI